MGWKMVDVKVIGSCSKHRKYDNNKMLKQLNKINKTNGKDKR